MNKPVSNWYQELTTMMHEALIDGGAPAYKVVQNCLLVCIKDIEERIGYLKSMANCQEGDDLSRAALIAIESLNDKKMLLIDVLVSTGCRLEAETKGQPALPSRQSRVD